MAKLRALSEKDLHWTPVKKPSSIWLNHLSATNEVRISAIFSAKTHGWSIPIWLDDYFLRTQEKDYVTITSPQGREKQVAVIPDGYFILNH